MAYGLWYTEHLPDMQLETPGFVAFASSGTSASDTRLRAGASSPPPCLGFRV